MHNKRPALIQNKAQSSLVPLIAALILAIAPQISVAASFDCQKTSSEVEKLICDEDQSNLSQIDEEMAQAYRAALQQAGDKEKEAIKSEQRRWLAEMSRCKTTKCLEIVYLPRITQLRDGQGGLQYAKPPRPLTIDSFEAASQLMAEQIQQLKIRQKKARDVLFTTSGWVRPSASNPNPSPDDERKVNAAGLEYCHRLWETLETQETFPIPQPQLFAKSPAEKQQLFDTVYQYATQNFNRYMEQNGNLMPQEYVDIWGHVLPIDTDQAIWIKQPALKDLPEKFKSNWQGQIKERSVSGEYQQMIDEDIAVQMLYMPPYPVSGFVRPITFILGRDQCTPCTGLSIGISQVTPNGRFIDDVPALSQHAYWDVLLKYGINKPEGLPAPEGSGSYINMGIAMVAGEFIYWQLREEIFDKQLAEKDDPYNAGKHYSYIRDFRRYTLWIRAINDPSPTNLNSVCEVKFN